MWENFVKQYPNCEKYGEAWLKSRNLDASPLSLEIPWINFPSIDFLENSLVGSSKIFEFGMGGSTVFSQRNRKKWFR